MQNQIQQIRDYIQHLNLVKLDDLYVECQTLHPMQWKALVRRFERAQQEGEAFSFNHVRYISRNTAKQWKEKHARRIKR